MSDELGASPRFPGVRIHDSSYVDDPVRIGAGTVIWHFRHVLATSLSARTARSDKT